MQHRSEPRTGRHCLEDPTADSGFLESAEVEKSMRASLIAQLLKNLPAMKETPVRFLGQEDLLEKG